MNIITVIPLTRNKVSEELSYFTARDVPVGAIVSVPIRSKSIHAIVTGISSAENQKSSIKKSSFVIRKLGRVKTTMFFPATFIETCKLLSEFYATTVGSIIHSLVPRDILENAHKIPAPLPRQDTLRIGAIMPDEASSVKEGIYAVQGDDSDRIGSWRSMVRQEFAKKRSVVIFAPTTEDVKNLYVSLQKGIEDYIYLLHNALTPKKMIEVWQKISDSEHPVIVIATSQFALLPRDDLNMVVIERENSRDWIAKRSPYIDFRHALEMISRKQHRTVYVADNLLRTETLHRLSKQEIAEGSPFKWRSISTARDITVDMRRPRDMRVDNEPKLKSFQVLSPQIIDMIGENIVENTHLFIYCARRGYAPNTVCADCESVVVCKQCSAPVVLHTSGISNKNFFMCHKCGERRSAEETCAYCDGWNLTTLGIGIDRVRDAIALEYPSVDIFKIDADATKTNKQIDEILDRFRSRPGSVLIGTEMVLAHFREKVDHVAIISVDSLFALPDFRIQEKIMHMITRLRSLATRSILLQTRIPTEKVFEYAMKGNLSDFYRSTLEERTTFKYPPFSILIKLSIEGKKDTISNTMAGIQDKLNPYTVELFPAFTSSVRGNSVIHGLIRLEPNAWPDKDLLTKLRALPPSVSVKVSPETLL